MDATSSARLRPYAGGSSSPRDPLGRKSTIFQPGSSPPCLQSPPAEAQRAPSSCSPPYGVAANYAALRVAKATPFTASGYRVRPRRAPLAPLMRRSRRGRRFSESRYSLSAYSSSPPAGSATSPDELQSAAWDGGELRGSMSRRSSGQLSKIRLGTQSFHCSNSVRFVLGAPPTRRYCVALSEDGDSSRNRAIRSRPKFQPKAQPSAARKP